MLFTCVYVVTRTLDLLQMLVSDPQRPRHDMDILTLEQVLVSRMSTECPSNVCMYLCSYVVIVKI